MKTNKVRFAVLFLMGVIFSGDIFGAVSNTPKTNSGGGVTAKVTYLNPDATDEPRYQVVLDTHSVNLDAYDLKGIAVLRDGNGNVYASTGVENKGSGHHREAIVSFSKLSQDAKRVELVIEDVAGVKERVIRWNVE